MENDVNLHKQPGCWLRSSHTFKECVIAHWSSEFARKITGAKLSTEIADLYIEIDASGRGAFCSRTKVKREHYWTKQKRECWNK